LLINTSHDGSIAIQASITPVRVVCANTLNVALNRTKKKDGVKQSFKIRHTQTANGKVAVARQALGMANSYMDEFDKMAHAMIQKEISAKDFNDIILAAYPKPELDTKGAIKKWENKVNMINDIYTGEYNGMISGNAWGAFNALTERLDWYRSSRSANGESMFAAASGFDPATNAEKNRLLTVVQKTLQIV
jgi:phage/plasmid-like protein (TIGR03299 family)